jgi:magnesium transporter
METRVGTARPTEAIEAVRARLAGTLGGAEVLCLTDARGFFAGMVTYSRLLTSPGYALLKDIAESNPAVAAPDDDQELVASRALAAGVFAVPVLDADGRLLGVVPPHALLRILRREHEEDMNRFVGIVKNGEQARNAIEGALVQRVMHRLPWLLVGLGGSMFATWLMAGFEDTLRAQLAVAFFVPAVVYLADAIGTQTEAVAVRGLSFSTVSLLRLLQGELLTGVAIGLILAAVIFPSVWLFFADVRLAAAVASAVVIAGACASSIGLLLPWWLSRAGADPAYGSGPLATILQDLLSLMTYLGVVTILI